MLNFYFDPETNTHKSFELPGARPHYNPDRPGQVEHIFLDLVLDIPNQSFQGTCTIHLNPIKNGIETLTLDAVNLEIKDIKIEQNQQEFDYDGEQLQIYLQQPTTVNQLIKIVINYSVTNPQRGLYFISPNKDYPDKPIQVWTQGEDEDSRFWFPCFDYPGQLATSEIRVQVPKQYLAISNGELINTETKGKTKIYHWSQKQVHPTYLMTLAVGDFAEIKDEWNGIPVLYYVEKNRQEDALRSMGKTPKMIGFFSEYFGYSYPYPKYAQVCVDDFIFGGMENTSTTLLTDRCLLDERATLDNRNTESLVAHELAHQWFGDLVVIKHWSHAWIKEGMATYTEVLWTEQEYGKDDAAYYRLNQARNYFSEDSSRYRRPIVTHIYREAIELYDRHLYEKGACVYHLIRTELGDELFKKAIQTFVQDNAHQTVETVDLLRALEKSTGANLLPLFDQYVFRGGHPDYKVSYSWDNHNKLAKITIKQNQATDSDKLSETNLFDLKIPIGFGYKPEKKSPDTEVKLKTFTVQVHEKEQTFYFPLEEKPAFISFDVNNNILKTVTLDYAVAELKAQLHHDPDPISRIYAAKALAKKGGLEAVKALSNALKNDGFWGVRVEVAKQLVRVKLDQVFPGLVEGLNDSDARVRRAVIHSLAKLKTTESYQVLKPLLEKGDPSYLVEASTAAALGEIAATHLEDKHLVEQTVKLLKSILKEREGWNEVVRSGAISGLSKLKTSEDALNLILKYTAPGIPQALRLTSIRALGSISTGQTPTNIERIVQRLEELSNEAFFLTQVAVVASLEQMETPKAMDVLQSLADQTLDGRVRRRAEEAIQTVQGKIGSEPALKKLREELDKIKKENQDLRSRLETLEAKSKSSKS
ncbi:Peptidase M1 membrane alanine aminopeptidase [Planktothrix sp. PCC 11201]|uniref:M1 family metallopeptidase n=1 Tax=Planktothrix sp. PCC 11201 TaxID=1729650 RepID=UPI00091D2645|nr:M1 family metallopeptidase [Planktothrix sp. PCC 11201]SKB15032.1 Peptidase M1 membrane alanine aminopeptidase [Planktothrix sp. PCC 11201]